MIPHQPSIRILQKTAEIIGLPWEKVMTNMDRYANTSGDLILFAAVASGGTCGASIIK
jgi:3-oxoacyl-[acyl-carrier-protein] synthase-3